MSFADDETRKVFDAVRSKSLPYEIQGAARRKLEYVNAVVVINELRTPSSNRLEKLEGEKNRWSIRINNKWRVCFTWLEREPSETGAPQPGDAYDAEITNHYD